MRKDTLKTSVFAVASSGLLFLSVASFDAAAEPPIEPDEEESNFLSVPAIFAEGYGLSGLQIVEEHDTGLPEGSDPDTWGLPYCSEGGATQYYLQGSYLEEGDPTSWQAQWAVAAASEKVSVTVDWSKEVIEKEWNDKSVIPVSVTLYTGNEGNLKGYEMKDFILDTDTAECVFDPEVEEDSDDVKWGTTPEAYGDYYDRATVFTVGAKLTIQKYEEKVNGDGTVELVPFVDEDGEPVIVLGDDYGEVTASFDNLGKPEWLAPAIDVEGRITYLFNWNLAAKQFGPNVDRSGWYRLTFSIVNPVTYTLSNGYSVEDRGTYENISTNVILAGVDASDTGEDVVYEPTVDITNQSTSVDIHISNVMGE
jgi:hypothetical protein